MRNQSGFSLPSVIVGSAIAAVLSAVAVTNMWGSVDHAKVTTLASVIKEQKTLFGSNVDRFNFDDLNANGDHDYLPELITAGILSPIPQIFEDKDALTFEVRMTEVGGYKRIYYTYIDSTNDNDMALINAAVEQLGYPVFGQ